ncbi:MAG TPA: AMP-binding protein [Baekduia sp.]
MTGAVATGTSTISATLDDAVARRGDAPWMVIGQETQTFTELGQRVDAIAAGLIAAGVEPGDGIALFLGNRFEWLQIEYAAAAIGAFLVPLNTWLRQRELTHILASSGCRVLLWGDRILRHDLRPLLQQLVPELTQPQTSVASARFPALKTVVGLGEGPWPAGVLGWEELLRRGEAVPASVRRERAAAVRPEDTGLVLYTSGTTGQPKGAVLSQTGIVDHMRSWTTHLGLGPDDRSIMASPLFWVFGCTLNAMVPLHAGSMTVLHERFDAERFLGDLSGHACTHLQGVPDQYELMLGHERSADHDLSAIRVVQLGGSRSVGSLARRLLERAPDAQMVGAYGLTEAVGVNTWTEFDDPIERLATTIGHPAPDNEVVLRDPGTLEPVEPGQVGEIWIRGGHVARGYLGDEEATAAAFVDGFLRTGDLASADEDGYLTLSGRLSHTYKRGGMNVYPAEIEALLAEHPAVQFPAVVGVPDERLGEVGAAFVVLAPGQEVGEAELLAWCEGQLADYKLPRYVRFVEELPMTASGKVRKHVLQEGWADGQPVA